MKKTALFLSVAVIILLLIAYLAGGEALVVEGLSRAIGTTGNVFLLIVMAFLVIGQLQLLISSEKIKSRLEKYSGNKGVVLSALAGGLFPGGPYIFYPFLAGFKDKGIPFYLLFAFVAGKQNYDFARLPLEISLISPGLALLRNLITLPVPLVMGLIGKRFFPRGVAGTDWDGDEQP